MATDTSKHLTALRIQNFKRFRDFELDNIGQFNLIVGKNNTGKTSLLEALLVDENLEEWSRTLLIALVRRKYKHHVVFEEHVFKEALDALVGLDKGGVRMIVKYLNKKFVFGVVDNYKPYSDYPYILYKEISNVQGDEYEIKFGLMGNVKYVERFSPFIPYGLGYGDELVAFLEQTIEPSLSKRTRFIAAMQLFLPNILDVRISKDIINIINSNEDQPTPLYSYGEGTNKLFRILCALAMAEGKKIMIDEIDAGIHHTKFKEFWTVVMQAATEYNVQIFATTHNEECVEYFVEALSDLEAQQEKARVIELYTTKEEQIKAMVYDYEAMATAEETGHEMRG